MHRLVPRLAMAALAATMMASVASAQTFTGTTAGGPTWNRPIAGTDILSDVGTNVAFNLFGFQVTQAGTYSFLSTATVPVWDNYLFLYETAFDPNDQFANLIIGNDDFPTIGLSGFNNVALTTGTNYFIVTTGFSNNSAGEYSLDISGQGTAFEPSVAVPEPASLALLGVGLFGLVAVRRRRVS